MGTEINQLWVNLSGFGEGNIFAIYPKLLSEIFRESIVNHVNILETKEEIVFPSDKDWRMKIYYQLVEKQRAKDSGMPSAWIPPPDEDKYWSQMNAPSAWECFGQPLPKRQRCTLESEVSLISQRSLGQVDWTVDDLVKAGALLNAPPMDVEFDDDQVMRRVFSLIYDVLRYKNILNQALRDISFFYKYPKLENSAPRVWLLLYDLYHRRFLKRDITEGWEAKFAKIDMLEVDHALWESHTRLAASVSRLRIKNSALSLNQLLPPHLRDERVASATDSIPVYCWVNTFRVSGMEEINTSLQSINFTPFAEDKPTLDVNEFRWDPICPQFICFHPTQRNFITQTPLARNLKLISQDRAFCLGPATFNAIVSKLELSGAVIQTHINSPRATAYLSALIAHNEKITKLLSFGAGSRKTEFENYMKDVGATNVTIFEQRLIDVAPDSDFLENVTAVFATPPNSYSAVSDPIDLVCSRGGDLSMLQVLTESDVSDEGRKRVAAILEEQRLTLRFAMSRPQIQFVLYETHSVVDAENKDMVHRVLCEMNQHAREHHAELQGIMPVTDEASSLNYRVLREDRIQETLDVNNNDDEEEKEKGEEDAENSEKLVASNEYRRFSLLSQMTDENANQYPNLKVPDTDLFEIVKLPDLCPNADSCVAIKEEGCYLALLQRKEITHLDAKYMINVAESRGLFGEENKDIPTKKTASKTSKQSKKRDDQRRSSSAMLSRPRRRSAKFEVELVERIAAPTQASLIRRSTQKRSTTEPVEPHVCPRHRPTTTPLVPRARRWWGETTRHIITIQRQTLVHRDIKSATLVQSLPASHFSLNEAHRKKQLARASASDTKPFLQGFPRLRLSRSSTRPRKIVFPIHISTVVLPKFVGVF